MFWRIALPSTLLVASAGCAGTAMPDVPADHPASVRAEATPLPPPSTTLAVGPMATTSVTAAAAAPPAAQHDLSGHGGGHAAHATGQAPSSPGQPGGDSAATRGAAQHDPSGHSSLGVGHASHQETIPNGRSPHPATADAAASAAAFVCPMHPEVVSATPDDRCPKCKMKLRAKPAAAAPASTAPATQPAAAGGHQHDHGGH